MVTRYEAWLNKKSLSALDPSIYILDISYEAPRTIVATYDIPGRNGQHVTNTRTQKTSVQITFEIHEQDTNRRQDVCRRVQEWAMCGGVLTTKDRRGQRLRVICDNLPAISSALKWTQPLKIVFTAYEQPFWEDEYARSVTINGESESKVLHVPGIGAMACVEATVKNESGGTINALTLGAGVTTFDFIGLALAAGDTLEIGYDEYGLLVILAGDESKMSCRTAASDDDLMIETGKLQTFSVKAGGSVLVTFRVRGLYL